jgi:hypothetical protein
MVHRQIQMKATGWGRSEDFGNFVEVGNEKVDGRWQVTVGIGYKPETKMLLIKLSKTQIGNNKTKTEICSVPNVDLDNLKSILEHGVADGERPIWQKEDES